MVMNKISVAVMAHKKRKQWTEELIERLDAPATVVWDKHNDVWETGRRSLLAAQDSDYHIVVQDDTLICKDLVAGVQKLLEFVPEHRPMCLYYGSRKRTSEYGRMYQQAKSSNSDWLVLKRGLAWGIGLAIPTEHINDIVAFGDKVKLGTGAVYDGRVRRWYQEQDIEQWYPIPSLVDHRSALEGDVSLMGRTNSQHRVAFEFIGKDNSPLDRVWTAKAMWADWHTTKNKARIPRR